MFSTLALLLASGASARTLEFTTIAGNFSAFAGGLYQSAVDNENGVVYVTDSSGKPPVNDSYILKVNATTLEIIEKYHAAFYSNASGVLADFGIGLDQSNQRVWVTNSRENTVSYHSASNLSEVTVYPGGSMVTPRDIVVDQDTGIAYAGSSTTDVIEAFTPGGNASNSSIHTYNLTELTGAPFEKVLGLALDETNQILYTVSMTEEKALALYLKNGTATAWNVTGASSASGVGLDTKRNHLYIASQKSNNTIVLDATDGTILKDISVGDGALYAKYDPVYDLVYVSCRTGSEVTVIDASDYSILARLNVTTPNQISTDAEGSAYVVDKSTASYFYKFTPKNVSSSNSSSSNSSSSNSSSSNSSSTIPSTSGAAGYTVPVAAALIAGVALLM